MSQCIKLPKTYLNVVNENRELWRLVKLLIMDLNIDS